MFNMMVSSSKSLFEIPFALKMESLLSFRRLAFILLVTTTYIESTAAVGFFRRKFSSNTATDSSTDSGNGVLDLLCDLHVTCTGKGGVNKAALTKFQTRLQESLQGMSSRGCQLWNIYPQWVTANLETKYVENIKELIMKFGASTNCPEFRLMSAYMFPDCNQRNPLQESGLPMIWVLGAPGSGKSNLCSKFALAESFTHISVGALLRAEVAHPPTPIIGQLLQQIMAKGDLVPDTVVLSLIVREMLNNLYSSKGFLFDGFPGDISQARLFQKGIRAPNSMVVLDVDENILRRGVLSQNEGHVNDDLFNKKLQVYHSQSIPVTDDGMFVTKKNIIVLSGSVDDNVFKFRTFVKTSLMWKGVHDSLNYEAP